MSCHLNYIFIPQQIERTLLLLSVVLLLHGWCLATISTVQENRRHIDVVQNYTVCINFISSLQVPDATTTRPVCLISMITKKASNTERHKYFLHQQTVYTQPQYPVSNSNIIVTTIIIKFKRND